MEFIQVGEEKKPIRFSYDALYRLGEEFETQDLQVISDRLAKVNINDIATLLRVGLNSGLRYEARVNKQSLSDESLYSTDDAINILDDDFSLFTKVMEGFTKSLLQSSGVDVAQAKKATTKKK